MGKAIGWWSFKTYSNNELEATFGYVNAEAIYLAVLCYLTYFLWLENLAKACIYGCHLFAYPSCHGHFFQGHLAVAPGGFLLFAQALPYQDRSKALAHFWWVSLAVLTVASQALGQTGASPGPGKGLAWLVAGLLVVALGYVTGKRIFLRMGLTGQRAGMAGSGLVDVVGFLGAGKGYLPGQQPAFLRRVATFQNREHD